MDSPGPHIGTLREKPLHASLKRWYARDGDAIETPVDGFVVDLVRGDLLIEIQTRGFASMKRKAANLVAAGHRLRIVHPVATDRWIVKLDEGGSVISRRRSPRHGQPLDLCSELVSFPSLLGRGVEIDVLLTHEEEFRRHDPTRAWRRRGWTVVERHLVEVVGSSLVASPEDLAALLPSGLPGSFTTADLALVLGRPRRAAQQVAYCLRESGAIVAVGKQGNALEYRMA